MRISLLALALTVLYSFHALGQTDTTRLMKFRYSNQFMAGALLGAPELGPSASLYTIHGIRRNNVAFGLGLGYEPVLSWTSVPVFASISYDFIPVKHNAVFIHINWGYSKLWHHETMQSGWVYQEHYGNMFNAQMGYRIRADHWYLYISTGYKFQRFKYEQTVPSFKRYVEYTMTRVGVYLGFGFH